MMQENLSVFVSLCLNPASPVLTALLFFLAQVLIILLQAGRRSERLFRFDLRLWRRSALRLCQLRRRLFLVFLRILPRLFLLSDALRFVAQLVGSLGRFSRLCFPQRAFSFGPASDDFLIRRHVLRELIVRLVLEEPLHEVNPHRQSGNRTSLLVSKRFLQARVSDPHTRGISRRVTD